MPRHATGTQSRRSKITADQLNNSAAVSCQSNAKIVKKNTFASIGSTPRTPTRDNVS